MTRCTFILTLVLLGGYSCRAQSSDAAYKQEIVELAHKADEKLRKFEQASLLVQPYISQAAFDKDAGYADTAHKAVAVLSNKPASAYASTVLLLSLNALAVDAANHARALYKKAMSAATSGQTVNMNELAAADSLATAQSALTEVSDSLGPSTLSLIAVEEKSNHEAARPSSDNHR
jgi:hypothetical protein